MEGKRRLISESEALFRRLGKLDVKCDPKEPQPPGGFDPVKRVAFPASEWNEAQWPRSAYPEGTHVKKGHIKDKFLLNDDDIIDLCFTERQYPNSYPSKHYLYVQLERRAWEKYGGPTGFQAALARKAERATRRLANRNPAAGLPGPVNKRGRGRPRGRPAPGNLQRVKGAPPPQQPEGPYLAPPSPPILQLNTTPAERMAGPSTPAHTPSRRARRRPQAEADIIYDDNDIVPFATPSRQTPRSAPPPALPKTQRAMEVCVAGPSNPTRTPTSRIRQHPHSPYPELVAGPSTTSRTPTSGARQRQPAQALDDSDVEFVCFSSPSRRTPRRRRSPVGPSQKTQVGDVIDISD